MRPAASASGTPAGVANLAPGASATSTSRYPLSLIPFATPAPLPVHVQVVALAALLLALPVGRRRAAIAGAGRGARTADETSSIWATSADAPEQAAFERRMQREVPALLATEGYFSPVVVVSERDW
jgi:hypothetical protein